MLPRDLPSSLASNRVIVNRYAVCKKIGNGTFGTVYLVEDNVKGKEKKVLKEVCIGDMTEQETQCVDREANLLSKLNHHNIVRMFESFVNEESFYIVMEFCEKGDLDRELKHWKTRREAVPQHQVMDWFVQLLIAVQYIHSQRMLHRDLKCKNVFLTENKTVKIGDFGISRILTSTEYASTFTGTPYYMSPEVIKHDGYGTKSDIWSLGVILYEICELKRAFDGKNLMSVMMKIIKGNLPLISLDRGKLGDIFKKMLRSDPHERPSSSQLLTEPLISAHLSGLRKRLHNKKRNVSSASSSTSTENRKMTARERMRLEKQRRADKEAEELRYAASENLAANRARTAARREREYNRPDFIKQSSPALEIKGINPAVIKHDRDFRYSSKSPSRPITAIHPEPRKRLSEPISPHDEAEKQLDAIEKSLEYAKAESLSKAIRNASNSVEVDGCVLNTTIEDFLEDASSPCNTVSSSSTLSSSSSSDVEELFETANDTCLLDVSKLELTAQIPEDPEEANTFYSFEEFEPSTPQEELAHLDFTKRSASLGAGERRGSTKLNRSLPTSHDTPHTTSHDTPHTTSHDTPQTTSYDTPHNTSHDKPHNTSHDTPHTTPHDTPHNTSHDTSSTQDNHNTSSTSDYTKSSTIVLRCDRIKTLRTKCETRLGSTLFSKIYTYLNDARYGDDVVPEHVIVQTLKDWVPQLTSDCFAVDQLLYLEKQEMLASKVLDL